jgi:hypothetical protein
VTHSFEVILDPRPVRETRARHLDIVISPVDDFTGRLVAGGVTAAIPRQSIRARRSLRGHLVFERLVEEPRHLVHIDPAKAGYFTPDPVQIDMPQDRATRILRLIRRPDAVIDGEDMVVRGSVVRQGTGDPVAGQLIEGRIAGIAAPFRTLTNERGNFALRLRPVPPILGAGQVPVPVTADVTLTFVGAGVPDMTLGDVEDMRTRVLGAEVEIP